MLKGKMLHPEILAALGQAGHGSKVLICDGNYPFATGSPESAHLVFLNLMPGMVKVTDVLEALIPTIPIEAAQVMTTDDMADQPIFTEFRKQLAEAQGPELEKLGRFPFYDAARTSDTALVIATGEQRIYANLLLTIGVVTPE